VNVRNNKAGRNNQNHKYQSPQRQHSQKEIHLHSKGQDHSVTIKEMISETIVRHAAPIHVHLKKTTRLSLFISHR